MTTRRAFAVAGWCDLCYIPARIEGVPGQSGVYPCASTALRKQAVFGTQNSERVDVSEPVSISTGIANRYATAIFELSKEGGALKALETDVDQLDAALKDSADLKDLISSPIYSREEQGAVIGAIADKMGLGAIVGNTLRLMATKRRLFVMPQLISTLRAMIAAEKGEVTAEVTAAAPLTAAQDKKLAATLKERVGKDVKINVTVDETLIGGLIVKVGSQMIDTSIRSRLASLQNTMKEVG